MKKKRPSLLDVEVFAQKRADIRRDKLKKIGEETIEAPEETLDVVDEENEPISYVQKPAQHKEDIPDAFMEELVDFVTTYRNEILTLKNDLFKVKEQVRIFGTMMKSQQKKISQLMELQQHGGTDNSVKDDNYYRLVLRNIIWLKEEKGFTTNDVIRLFRAEGFQTPAPHKAWNEKVVESLYAEAKKTIY